MGLDMYLEQEHYVGGHHAHNQARGGVDITVGQGDGTRHIKLPATSIGSITCPVAYWRKANAIHGWFVREVQDGQDDCKRYYVDAQQLTELRNLCQDIVDNVVTIEAQVVVGVKLYTKDGGPVEEPILKPGQLIVNNNYAAERLPFKEGFFFGSTEYNNFYLEYLRYTIEALSDLDNYTEYYYHASW